MEEWSEIMKTGFSKLLLIAKSEFLSTYKEGSTSDLDKKWIIGLCNIVSNWLGAFGSHF